MSFASKRCTSEPRVHLEFFDNRSSIPGSELTWIRWSETVFHSILPNSTSRPEHHAEPQKEKWKNKNYYGRLDIIHLIIQKECRSASYIHHWTPDASQPASQPASQIRPAKCALLSRKEGRTRFAMLLPNATTTWNQENLSKWWCFIVSYTTPQPTPTVHIAAGQTNENAREPIKRTKTE